MSGRGRRAVLPPAGHRVEPPLAPDGLVVTVVNKAGYDKEFNFAGLPAAEPMQRSLARVFAAQSRHWTSHQSAVGYWRALEAFARFLAELDHPPRDLDELTPAMLKRWRQRHVHTNTGRISMSLVRPLLSRDPRLGAGPVAEELARRIPEPSSSKQSYGEKERQRVLLAARREFRAAWMRIRENTDVLESWRAGQLIAGTQDWRLGQLLDHVARNGDVPRITRRVGGPRVAHPGLLGGGSPERTWGRLFLMRSELTALAVLLTDRFGWNLSVYNRMPAPTAMPSAAEPTTVTYQVTVEKRRGGAGRWFSTENITDAGADSDGRLITQALQATTHGRALAATLAPGVDLLMTARTRQVGRRREDWDAPQPVGPLVFGVPGDDVKRWVRRHKLNGSPFQRIRRTTVTREGRPLQHSPGTHESVYLLPDQQVQRASQRVFAEGAREALGQARSVVFAGSLADAADPAHRETATADCSDESRSPWPSADGNCAADFLLCLACRNAHVHPGHHPRLAHLHQQVLSLRSVLPEAVWQEQWSEHLPRLEDLRSKIGPVAWSAALSRVDTTDRAVVNMLVKGELAP